MDLWRDLRGFVGLPDDEGASSEGAVAPPQAPSEYEDIHSLKPEILRGNRVVGAGIRSAWALVRPALRPDMCLKLCCTAARPASPKR